jgi:hypothetical protein
MAIGMGLLIGGYIIYNKEKKKEKPSKSLQIFGIVLMAFGCLIGLGFGGSLLFESIGDMI